VGAFGDKFRKEREKKNFSLDDVSQVTKIGTRMLRAIEEERFDQLPGGVFNKGFIRAYAKHLGMNDEKAVADYLACQRQTQLDANEAWEPARPAKDQPPSKKVAPIKKSDSPAAKAQTPTQVEELPELQLPRAEHVRPPRNKFLEPRDTGIPWRIVAAAALVIVLAAILWHRHSRSPRTEAASAPPARPVLATQSTPAPVLTPASQTSNAHSAGTPPHPSTANAQPSASMPSPSAVHSSVPAKPVPNAAQSNAPGSTQPAAPTSLASPAPPLTLIIRASENSWISVLADGQAVSEETLIAPAHTSVRAKREIVVKTGNAAGVSFLWNGKEVPAQGAEAEVRTFVFDASGMRTTTPAQPAQN